MRPAASLLDPARGRGVAIAAVLLSVGLLAGCAGRPGPEALSAINETVPGVSEHVILVASSRERDPNPGVFFNGERTTALNFARIDITVPPTHKPGQTEVPRGTPNPATDMTVREAIYRDTPEQFTADLKAELARRKPGDRDVTIFIHGYNTLFSEALYRFTQMAEDSKQPGVPVLFTWASRGSVADYVYDTNSATAARDRLEETIRLILSSGAEKITILAHSMGNWVTVEALRQIKISGTPLPPDKIENIILAAPDIDVDVFKSQLKRFGKPPKPFIVIVSRDDKALAFSDFIAGDKPRLGAYTNDEELVELGAVVVDMTKVKSADEFNHGKFAQLAAMAPELRGMMARAQARAGAQEMLQQSSVAGIQFVGVDKLVPTLASTAPGAKGTSKPLKPQSAVSTPPAGTESVSPGEPETPVQ
ncbi:alpha/beta hydrolase [Ancylobacter sp. WKF20]|uniref:alpha/beta hydrolase n=1 Tax=Ancylobacter sp. WKF20 TaxID=3039801 RepID=UPI002434660E|nr:alpha/beta hydrolase [Ancylobacter sp. WKF20]WGD28461.1 alpha/beta hydrolase [Ancylobacter sp. WKF20]